MMKIVLKWFLGVSSFLFGIFIIQISVIAGILFLVAGAFLIPPIFKRINKSRKINRTVKIAVIIISFLGAVIIGGKASSAEVEAAMKKIEERKASN